MFFNDDWDITEVLDDIILGRGVKRSIHDIEYDGKLYVDLFIQRLQLYKYRPQPVYEIEIKVGQRAPAFYIQGRMVIFGYVFWEVFSTKRKRKLWGSVVRNEKGDWKYTLPGNSEQVVFVNLDQALDMDIGWPTGPNGLGIS